MPDPWWTDTTAVALLGTGRRPPLPLPPELGVRPRAQATPEEELLDAAALGGMLLRAGGDAATYDAGPPAPADDGSPPPDRAVQLLQLLLTQPPVGARLAPAALARWLSEAAGHQRRVPHAELPALLEAATRSPELQPLLAPVAGARGRWLASANPAWGWLTTEAPVVAGDVPTAEEWATMQTADRVMLLAPLRATDPATARALVESTWSTDSARDRPLLLGGLQHRLSLDDEELLERALDDRASGVRGVARTLLDRLPDSARGRRMSERLRPLVRMSGLLRRTLEIDLPTEADAAAVRDGLDKSPASRSSQRGYWLEQMAAAVPLDFWTEITGRGVADTWRLVHDASTDARGGVMRAAMSRHDVAWLRAMIAHGAAGTFLKHLPPVEAAEEAVTSLRQVRGYDLAPTLDALAGPWSRRLADAVLDRLQAEKEPADVIGATLPLLAERLPADVLPRLRTWASADGSPRPLADLVQYLTFVPAIPEAFG